MLKWTALVATIIYLALAIGLYAYQDNLLFHPAARPADHTYGAYPESAVPVAEGVELNALTVSADPGQVAPGVVLYLHGNRGDNGRSVRQTSALTDLGYDLFLVDYRGFGKSTGAISSDAELTEDLQAVYDYLLEFYAEENIIVMGYSLGTGPATYLAAKNRPRGAVLVAPYTSLLDMKNEFFWMFPDFLLRYEMSNLRNLRATVVPVRIVHGTADPLIPVGMARRLLAANPEVVRLAEAEGVSHRGAIFDPAVREAVWELIGR